MTDPTGWRTSAREQAARAIAIAAAIDADPWRYGPGLQLALLDLHDATRAAAALDRHPRRPHSSGRVPTLTTIMGDYVTGRLAAIGEPPVTPAEVAAAVAEVGPIRPEAQP